MHPFGTISAAVTYLTAPHFQIDTLEALLSSRFLDEGPEFTPTLTRNQQRESLSTSPGSLPIRTSLPRSPPSNAASLADRFVLPAAGSRTSFPSSSPRFRGANLPALAGSTGSGGSSSRLSQEGQVASALPPRVRHESIGAGRSSSVSVCLSFCIVIRKRLTLFRSYLRRLHLCRFGGVPLFSLSSPPLYHPARHHCILLQLLSAISLL